MDYYTLNYYNLVSTISYRYNNFILPYVNKCHNELLTGNLTQDYNKDSYFKFILNELLKTFSVLDNFYGKELTNIYLLNSYIILIRISFECIFRTIPQEMISFLEKLVYFINIQIYMIMNCIIIRLKINNHLLIF